jgi:hypothetical protein
MAGWAPKGIPIKEPNANGGCSHSTLISTASSGCGYENAQNLDHVECDKHVDPSVAMCSDAGKVRFVTHSLGGVGAPGVAPPEPARQSRPRRRAGRWTGRGASSFHRPQFRRRAVRLADRREFLRCSRDMVTAFGAAPHSAKLIELLAENTSAKNRLHL